jgi:hypothetical protein
MNCGYFYLNFNSLYMSKYTWLAITSKKKVQFWEMEHAE